MRSFIDQDGVQWQVWETLPQSGFSMERRLSDRTANAGEVTRECPPEADRRRGNIRKGWLCFESSHERRRLFPLPSGWRTIDVPALEALCRSAIPVRRGRPDAQAVQAMEAPSAR
jgi:hypothetical protein